MFCSTHSHSKVFDETENDPAILGEAKAVSKDLMALFNKIDADHFNQMKNLLDTDS